MRRRGSRGDSEVVWLLLGAGVVGVSVIAYFVMKPTVASVAPRVGAASSGSRSLPPSVPLLPP
jgi:hypothetical protein